MLLGQLAGQRLLEGGGAAAQIGETTATSEELAALQQEPQLRDARGVKTDIVKKRVNRLASKWFARSLFRRLSCPCPRHNVLEDCCRRQGLRICCHRPRPGFWWLAQAAAGARACSCLHCQSRSRLACQFPRIIRLRCSRLLTWPCTALSARRARQRLLSCLVPAAQAPRCWQRSAFVLAGFFATCLRLPDRREAFRRRRRLVLQSCSLMLLLRLSLLLACIWQASSKLAHFGRPGQIELLPCGGEPVLFRWRFCALLCLARGVW